MSADGIQKNDHSACHASHGDLPKFRFAKKPGQCGVFPALRAFDPNTNLHRFVSFDRTVSPSNVELSVHCQVALTGTYNLNQSDISKEFHQARVNLEKFYSQNASQPDRQQRGKF